MLQEDAMQVNGNGQSGRRHACHACPKRTAPCLSRHVHPQESGTFARPPWFSQNLPAGSAVSGAPRNVRRPPPSVCPTTAGREL